MGRGIAPSLYDYVLDTMCPEAWLWLQALDQLGRPGRRQGLDVEALLGQYLVLFLLADIAKSF